MNAAIKRVNEARDASTIVTCPASRHAQMIGENLIEFGQGDRGESILYTVAALYEARAEIAKLKAEIAKLKGEA